VNEAEEVLGVPIISDDEPSEVMEPGEQALDLPTALVASEWAAILGLDLAALVVWSDQLDTAQVPESLVQDVTVVGLVANQAVDEVGQKCVAESLFDERRLVRRSTCDANGDWKTCCVCNRHDLGALAPLGFSDGSAPFLAPLKEPSMKVSLRSIPPRSCRSRASAWSTRLSVPSRHHR